MIRVLETLATAYPKQASLKSVLPRADGQLRLVSAKLINNSGSSSDLGIFRGLANNVLFAAIAAASYTDVTASINAGTSTTIIPAVNGDGFVVGSEETFGLVPIVVSQADGGGATYTYQYWNGVALATLSGISLPANYSTLAEAPIVFPQPIDWAPGITIAGVTVPDQTKYYIYVKATTAGAAALKVNYMKAAQMIDYQEGVATKGFFSWAITTLELSLRWNSSDWLQPYFGVAANTNIVCAQRWAQDS